VLRVSDRARGRNDEGNSRDAWWRIGERWVYCVSARRVWVDWKISSWFKCGLVCIAKISKVNRELSRKKQQQSTEQSVPGTLWDWTWARQPSRMLHTTARATRAHRIIHAGAIATLIKAIIGASNWLVGNKTRPPSSSLATAHCRHPHHQPHPRHAASSRYTAQHASRLPGTTRHRNQSALDYHHTPYLARPLPGQWS
jgi:hypothetical protein